MKLREIKVQNFRCLADVTIPIGDTTVLVGANNSGKTALLDALRIALTGNRANRGTPFDEYDYHMSKVGDSPQTSQGTGNLPGDYIYRITFDLTGLEPATAVVSGAWTSDNTGPAVLLNGVITGVGSIGQTIGVTLPGSVESLLGKGHDIWPSIFIGLGISLAVAGLLLATQWNRVPANSRA